MRIVFIGAVEFSLRALGRLVSLGADIVGICTLKESKFNADHIDLTSMGGAHGIPCFYADDINSTEALMWIKSKAPDIIFCFGWSKLLKQALLTLAPLGVVGFHPAALPANRGRHPIIWSLVLGLDKTASTFFFMDEGADSGDILSQREILISDHDDARTLYNKVTETALAQIEEFLPLLTRGSAQRIKQSQINVNTWRKRGRTDGLIDWRMSAQTIHNLVRGLAKPYVGAHFLADGKEIKIWKTLLYSPVENNIEPGKVLAHSINGSVVKCGEGAICLIETEPAFLPNVGDYL
jgi:methionyl-tRNA formyltransferase